MAQTRRDRRFEEPHRWVREIPGMTVFKGVHMYWTTRFYPSKLLSACDICHLCQFTPLHARGEIISNTCLQFLYAESKYLDQHAHMHMLINAFAIPSAIKI